MNPDALSVTLCGIAFLWMLAVLFLGAEDDD
jgi:hypothetical protein